MTDEDVQAQVGGGLVIMIWVVWVGGGGYGSVLLRCVCVCVGGGGAMGRVWWGGARGVLWLRFVGVCGGGSEEVKVTDEDVQAQVGRGGGVGLVAVGRDRA